MNDLVVTLEKVSTSRLEVVRVNGVANSFAREATVGEKCELSVSISHKLESSAWDSAGSSAASTNGSSDDV